MLYGFARFYFILRRGGRFFTDGELGELREASMDLFIDSVTPQRALINVFCLDGLRCLSKQCALTFFNIINKTYK